MVLYRLRAEWKRKRHSEFCTYASIIGNRITISIAELASKCGKSTSIVISDLQAMIDKGYFRDGAYIDRKCKLLILDPSVFETVFVYEEAAEPSDNAGVIFEAEFVSPEPEMNPTTDEKSESTSSSAEEAATSIVYGFSGSEEYAEKLRQIQRLDVEINDEAVSARIDRIGHLTASIFHVVEEHPERADEVRRFMNYYLPTTFKLLKSYSLMEKQSYQGENIAAARKKIEGILDTLVLAFEKQLDRLFKAEAMDVDADISVLETMMTTDGLIEPPISLKPRTDGKKPPSK